MQNSPVLVASLLKQCELVLGTAFVDNVIALSSGFEFVVEAAPSSGATYHAGWGPAVLQLLAEYGDAGAEALMQNWAAPAGWSPRFARIRDAYLTPAATPPQFRALPLRAVVRSGIDGGGSSAGGASSRGGSSSRVPGGRSSTARRLCYGFNEEGGRCRSGSRESCQFTHACSKCGSVDHGAPRCTAVASTAQQK